MTEREARQELLFRAIGGVGGDLIDTADKKVFPMGFWRRWMPAAACLALLVGLTLWVRPWFLPGEPVEVPAQTAQPPAAVQQSPAQQETLQPPQKEPVRSKVRLTVFETEYYVESYLPADRVEVEAALGIVAASDGGVLDGADVYQAGETWKENKQGRQIPLEILVEYDGGYLYCLSYFAWDGPLYTAEEIRNLWAIGQWDTLVQTFGAGPVFADPADLTAEELLEFFLITLRMEETAGRRSRDLSRYLWETDGRYLIPLADVTGQLDRYLEGYVFTPQGQPWYDKEYEAVVLDNLDPEEEAHKLQPGSGTGFDSGTNTLTLVVDYCSEDGTPIRQLVCTIQFTDRGCMYRSILVRE